MGYARINGSFLQDRRKVCYEIELLALASFNSTLRRIGNIGG